MKLNEIEKNPDYKIIARSTLLGRPEEYVVVRNNRFDTRTTFLIKGLETLTAPEFDLKMQAV